MENLANGVVYPECLCPPSKTPSPPGILCEDGLSRLTGKPPDELYFLPLEALKDGMKNPSLKYGFWPAPRHKQRVSFKLHQAAQVISPYLICQNICFYILYSEGDI